MDAKDNQGEEVKPEEVVDKTEATPALDGQGEIKVPILDLPSRSEVRSILKTGKGQDGTPVHPDTQRNLRKATIADILAFGNEVNKANAALNRKMESIIDNTDLALKEVHWNFATFLSFLGSKGILDANGLADYEEFKAKAGEELEKAAEYLFKQQEAQKDAPPTEGEEPAKEPETE